MGNENTQSQVTTELPPFVSMVRMFPNSCATTSNILKVTDHWFTLRHDEFVVTTTDGHEFLKISGSSLQVATKTVMDMSGNPLFTIDKKFFSYPATYVWKDPQGQEILEVVGYEGVRRSIKSKAKFQNAEGGKPIELDLEADPINYHGEIKVAGTVIASFRHMDSSLKKTERELTIAANVDRVLIVSLVICMDERWGNKGSEKPMASSLREDIRLREEISQN